MHTRGAYALSTRLPFLRISPLVKNRGHRSEGPAKEYDATPSVVGRVEFKARPLNFVHNVQMTALKYQTSVNFQSRYILSNK